MQDFLRMYSNLVEKCFNSCCNDFTSKALSSKEVPYDFFSRLLEALNRFVTNLAGTMRHELHRKVHKAFRTSRSKIFRVQRRYVSRYILFDWVSFHNISFRGYERRPKFRKTNYILEATKEQHAISCPMYIDIFKERKH